MQKTVYEVNTAKYVTLAHVPITVLAFLYIPHAPGNSAAKYPIFTLQFKDALFYIVNCQHSKTSKKLTLFTNNEAPLFLRNKHI